MGAPIGNTYGTKRRKYRTAKALKKKVDAYFDHCDNKVLKRVRNRKGEVVEELTEPYTVSGLAAFLGINRKTLLRYKTRGSKKRTENKTVLKVDKKQRHIIKNALQKIEASYETNAIIGRNHPIFSMFILKNNFSYADKRNLDLTSKNKQVKGFNITVTDEKPKKD